ncbi:MAG: hypothetical protein VW239_00335 [Candidatus Nanopelagicales bacterium]
MSTETTTHKLRCGDVVRMTKPPHYELTVAYEDNGRLAWSGWPEGTMDTDDVELVRACTDEEHRSNVALWFDGEDPSGNHRRETIKRLYRPRQYARECLERALAALNAATREVRVAEVALDAAMNGPEEA